MLHVYLRAIEPQIAIVLDRGMRYRPLSPSDALSLPSLGVSSLDLGRLWQRKRPFFCMPSGPQSSMRPPLFLRAPEDPGEPLRRLFVCPVSLCSRTISVIVYGVFVSG